MKIKINPSLFAYILIIAGILFFGFGVVNAISTYRANHSPLDVADTSVQQLDQQNNFIPLLQEVIPSDQGKIAATPAAPSSTNLSQEGLNSTPESATGEIPEKIVIPQINLNAPIIPVHFKLVSLDGQTYEQWLVPNQFAAGWQDTTAQLGLPGNTVLDGHHNEYGKVFGRLVMLSKGDLIEVYSGSTVYKYSVTEKLLLPERYESVAKRIENAQWILPTSDERLTLVTCWPANTNTYRLIIVAYPLN
jgi:sortase A